MKKLCTSLYCLLLCSFFSTRAQVNAQNLKNDVVIHIYQQLGNSFYYLSAVDGGGDEVLAQKITGEPGTDEEFILELKEVKQKGFGIFALKTMEGHYLQVTEELGLIAEGKDYQADLHAFEMRIIALSQQVRDFHVHIQKPEKSDVKACLLFSPENENFQIAQSPGEPPALQARLLADGFEKLKFGPVRYALQVIFDGYASPECKNRDWEGSLIMENPYKDHERFVMDLTLSSEGWVFANTIDYNSKPVQATIRFKPQTGYDSGYYSTDPKGCLIQEIRMKGEETDWNFTLNEYVKRGETIELFTKGKVKVNR